MIVAKHHETPGSIIVSIAGSGGGVVAIIIISFIQRLVAPHNQSYNYYYFVVPENLINYGAYLQPGGGEGQRLIKKHITWLSTQSLLEVNQAFIAWLLI